MNRTLALLTILLVVGCSPKKWLHESMHDGVQVQYRWNHPKQGDSELLLVLRNSTLEDRSISLQLDLYRGGLTVEQLLADTCIGAGRTLNAKVNGIYFVPGQVTTAQIKAGEVQVEMTTTEVAVAGRCPDRSE
jgi:hypothetical protein